MSEMSGRAIRKMLARRKTLYELRNFSKAKEFITREAIRNMPVSIFNITAVSPHLLKHTLLCTICAKVISFLSADNNE